MQRSAKRKLGIAAAVASLLAALLSSSAMHRLHEGGLRKLAAQLSSNGGTLAQSAFEARLRMIESQAQAAAQLPQIRGQISTFDAETLRDGFRSEAWWAPFRLEFSVYGVATDGPGLAAVEGMNAAEIDAAPLVAEAREKRQASALILAGPKGWPYAAGAAVIDLPRPRPAVVFLAQAIDQAFAEDLAARLGAAILVSDGRDAMLIAGNDGEQARLRQAVGHEGQGRFQGEDPTWAAAATPLVGKVTLWTYATVGAQALEVRRDDLYARSGIWLLGLLIAGLSLWLGLGRGKTGGSGVTGEAWGSSGQTPVMLAAPGLLAAALSPAPIGDGPPDAEGATAIRRAPSQPGRPGKNVFGRYVLMDRLGEGGMAEVYTAVVHGAEGFRRTFVIKRLRPELARLDDVVAAFIDEANLASSLVHANIVPVFDFGKVDDEYFLAQEYILGRDLGRVNRRALEREGAPLSLSQSFYLAHEVLKALDYAHNRMGPDGKPLHLVHRDVSPNNILISSRGEVKLFDFGVAKAQGRITQTQFGMVKGNVRFMSPEQARGDLVDGRSDLFSLGLVLYYALAGDSLYEADTAYNLLVRAAQGPGDKERELLSRLPEEAQRVLGRALQPNPADRFQTASEFAQALSPFLVGAHETLVRTMERLFGEDIRAEEARFATAAAVAETAAQVSQTGRFAAPGKPNG
jgi:hypothetical protein